MCIKLCKQDVNLAVIICDIICMVSYGCWGNTPLHWTSLGKLILVLPFPMLWYSNTDRNSPTTIDLQHNLVLYMGPFSGPRSVHKKSVTNGLPPHLDISNMSLMFIFLIYCSHASTSRLQVSYFWGGSWQGSAAVGTQLQVRITTLKLLAYIHAASFSLSSCILTDHVEQVTMTSHPNVVTGITG